MGIAINILLNGLLIASLAIFLIGLFSVVWNTVHPVERFIRGMALFAGAMVVLGAQASGASYADFILDALGGTKPLSFGLLGVVAPGLAGAGLAWYFVRVVRQSENLAVRVLAFTGMLASTQFAVLYGVSLNEKGFELGKAAVPNITFLVGVFLYVILKFDPQAVREERGTLRNFVDYLKSRPAKDETPQPENPFAPR